MTDFLLLPYPRSVEEGTGIFILDGKISIYYQGKDVIYKTIIKELDAEPVKNKSEAQVKLMLPGETHVYRSDCAENPEGYVLVINSNGIDIFASGPAGHLYGIMTLVQLRCQFGVQLPQLRIDDAPVMSHRGASLTFPQGNTAYRAAYMKHLIPQLTRWKINTLYLYLETYFQFPSLPHVAGPGAMKPSDAEEMDRLCRAYNIKLIPELNVMGHCGEILALQRYSKLAENNTDEDVRTIWGNSLCACSPEVDKVIDSILEDVMNCFSSDIIHVGGDEVYNLGVCPVCTIEAGKIGSKQGLYIRYFSRIKEILNRRGRKMGIWGDMLLHYFKDIPPVERKTIFEPLSRGAIIYDWSYDGSSPDDIDFFVKEGFETIACSSTNLYNSPSLWPYQSVNQRMLFADAAALGASGGMTTAWCNYLGLHEEHFNYLFASGGTALWSGAAKEHLALNLSNKQFEKSYSLQRYGLKTDALTQFWHILGDAGGPVLKALTPLQGANMRKCIYHTDNVLTLWVHYSRILSGEKLELYRDGILQARQLWDKVVEEAYCCSDPYLHLQAAPLLMHEHLIRRFDITESVYSCYDSAAQVQFDNPELFKKLLEKAVLLLLSHLDDFSPVEGYLTDARKLLGLERSSIVRVRETKRNIGKLASFLRYLSVSNRPLPAFIQLHDMFLERCQTNFFIGREHEWITGPKEFQRYSILPRPWDLSAAREERENQ